MKQLLVFVFVVCSLTVNAQKIRYSDTRNRWVSIGIRTANDCTFSRMRYYGADTLISGNSYHITIDVYFQDSVTLCGRYIDTAISYFVREDTIANIVYYRSLGFDTGEHVLYNYNLQIGDTISYYPPPAPATPPPFVVVTLDSVFAIDSTLINGVYHKVFHMISALPSYQYLTYSYIEGIGSPTGAYLPFHMGCTTDHETLTCFSQNGLTPAVNAPFYYCNANRSSFTNGFQCSPTGVPSVISSPPTVSIAPNPADNIITVSNTGSVGSSVNIRVYNYLGRVVFHDDYCTRQSEINTSSWPDGTYTMAIYDNRGNYQRQKIVVMH